MRNQTGTIWPSTLQERLLVVALESRSDVATRVWQEIRPRLTIDRLEPGSFELMPLVYRNLSAGEDGDPELPRLKGIYRRTWVKNNLLAEHTRTISRTLAEAGISALFVEGAAIASRFYPELGLRPTSVIDILVDERDWQSALIRLGRAGWARGRGAAPIDTSDCHLFDVDRNVCLLRSKLAYDCIPHGVGGKSFAPRSWRAETSHSLGGMDVPVPPSTETLFAVIVSGARHKHPPNLQWIVDAKMVLGADVDWPRLIALGGESGQIARLREALAYLAELPGPQPPVDVRAELGRTQVSARERFIYRCAVGSFRGTGALPLLIAEHLSRTADRSLPGAVASFPAFLRARWSLTRTWHVPFAAVRRALRVLRGRGETRSA